MNPQDALLLLQSEIPANGQHFITRLLRQVPMLMEDQVVKNLQANNIDINLNHLMRITVADITFYIADQFAEDGSLQPEVAELMNIFRRQPDFKEWDIAMWWINPTGWLSGDRPRDVYKDNLEGVKFAAEQEILHLEH
jgi:hypothetical protein